VTDTTIAQAKQATRERIWTLLEARGAADGDPHGSIPAFVGANAAADRLADLPEWRAAGVIKAVPDRPQLPVRVRALTEGKIVYMAVPNMADIRPFYLLDPTALTAPFDQAASSRGAASTAPRVGTDEMRPVDMIVCGSVAVNRRGARLGKGAGYSDIEVALLQQAGLIDTNTTIVTTVHSLQVIGDDLPETAHDFSVDLIVTPDEVIGCGPPRRPAGIIWDDMPPEKIAAIPVLGALRDRPSGRSPSR
jgi:5-formyltetrahydrofolate cyclo-ligase